MKFGIVSKLNSKEALDISKNIINFLGEVAIEENLARKIGTKGLPLNKMNVDILITVGGDGTILRALQYSDANVFGVNAGILGFLTEAKESNVIECLEKIQKNEFIVDKRIKLKVSVNRQRLNDCTNEAVIHTAHIAKMRHFEIEVDGKNAEDIRADGIIVATPTGSTCYAMSVGSPIIDPRVNAFVIAPIAPFKLSARAIIVSATSEIKIKFKEKGKRSLLVLDGQQERIVNARDTISFGISEKEAKFIRFDTDFYKKINEKLVF